MSDLVFKALQRGDLVEIYNLVSNKLTPAEALFYKNNGQSLFDFLIEKQNYPVIDAFVRGLAARKDTVLETLLREKNSKNESPLVKASKLTNPQIFELLLKQPIDSLEDLEASKKQRKLVTWSREGPFGILNSLLKSACPSKALSDSLNNGITLAVGPTLLVGAAFLPFLVGGFAIVGLLLLTASNYMKLRVEQNLEDETVNTKILLAQYNILKARIIKNKENLANFRENTQFQEDLAQFKTAVAQISKATRFGDRKNGFDFLTSADKRFAKIATFGDVLCTSAGLAAIAILIAGATAAFPIAIIVVSALVVSSILYYIRPRQAHLRELAEQRRAQFDDKQLLYKNLKEFNNENNFLFVQEEKISKNTPLFGKQVKTKWIAFLQEAVRQGDRRSFKRLIWKNNATVEVPADGAAEETLLHIAVKAKQSLIIEEMLGVSISAKARKNSGLRTYGAQDVDLQTKRSNKIERFKTLEQSTKALLLIHDSKGKLPLHYAAAQSDPTIYDMLLKQAVGYSVADLEMARGIRKSVIKKQKIWNFYNAILESICPNTSLAEIVNSVAFTSLTLGAAGLGLGVGLASIGIFALVLYGNYYKGNIERGITNDLEAVTFDTAYAKNLELRIKELQKKNNAERTPAEIAKLQAFKSEWLKINAFIEAHPLLNAAAEKSAARNARARDIARGLAVSFGVFICAYAGTLGLIGLAAATFAVTLTNPVTIGIGVGLAFTAFYLFRLKNDLKVFDERRQTVSMKKNALATIVNSFKEKAVKLLNEETPQPSRAPSVSGNPVLAPRQPELGLSPLEIKGILAPVVPAVATTSVSAAPVTAIPDAPSALGKLNVHEPHEGCPNKQQAFVEAGTIPAKIVEDKAAAQAHELPEPPANGGVFEPKKQQA